MKFKKIILNHSKNSVKKAITIGSFDGLHLGHQALIQSMNEISNESQLTRILISFEPLPSELFGKISHVRLMSLRDKILYLKNNNLVDEIWILPFTKKNAALSHEEFLANLLSDDVKMDYLIVGEDFSFGKKALGNVEFLEKKSQTDDFGFIALPDILHSGKRISSTHIRQLLKEDDLKTAELLLGHPYTISGKVIHGQKLARQLGFPTINIAIHHEYPLIGVYNVKAYCHNTHKNYIGIANIGFKPTINGKIYSFEVHLHNTDENLYGQVFSVEFLSKLRSEIKFNGIAELQTQIQNDVVQSKKYFENL